jgi:hypothetical protein
LLLADISGSTSFLQTVAAAHRDDAFADRVGCPGNDAELKLEATAGTAGA